MMPCFLKSNYKLENLGMLVQIPLSKQPFFHDVTNMVLFLFKICALYTLQEKHTKNVAKSSIGFRADLPRFGNRFYIIYVSFSLPLPS